MLRMDLVSCSPALHAKRKRTSTLISIHLTLVEKLSPCLCGKLVVELKYRFRTFTVPLKVPVLSLPVLHLPLPSDYKLTSCAKLNRPASLAIYAFTFRDSGSFTGSYGFTATCPLG